MTNTEGLLFVLILAEIIAGLAGCGAVFIVHALLVRTRYRLIRLIVLVFCMGVNLAYLIHVDAPLMISGSLILGIPMAVLVPPLFFPHRIGGPVGISGIIYSYAVVWVVGAILPFLLVASGLSMVPGIYWHTPVSNGCIYLLLMAGTIALATIIFRVLVYLKPGFKEPSE